jgi:CheY-like chemotaxis protein
LASTSPEEGAAEGTGEVEIRVADTGIGIAPRDLTKVFELFTQAHERTERPRGGLGIGLALVQRLVEMHGGQVTAHSEGLGHGAEFVVRLPLWAVEEARAVVPSELCGMLAEPTATPRRVLIVDDNIDAAEALTMLLTAAGHQVRVAHDGLAGLDAGEAFAPDVVLLDLGMPRLDGVGAAERIRATGWGRDALLIALTGWGQERDRMRTTAAGFDRHLVKPVADSELLRAVSGSTAPSRKAKGEPAPPRTHLNGA